MGTHSKYEAEGSPRTSRAICSRADTRPALPTEEIRPNLPGQFATQPPREALQPLSRAPIACARCVGAPCIVSYLQKLQQSSKSFEFRKCRYPCRRCRRVRFPLTCSSEKMDGSGLREIVSRFAAALCRLTVLFWVIGHFQRQRILLVVQIDTPWSSPCTSLGGSGECVSVCGSLVSIDGSFGVDPGEEDSPVFATCHPLLFPLAVIG